MWAPNTLAALVPRLRAMWGFRTSESGTWHTGGKGKLALACLQPQTEESRMTGRATASAILTKPHTPH